MIMPTNIAHKFTNPDGTLNIESAMQAGRDARADALRSFMKSFVGLMTSCLQRDNFKRPLTNLKT
jgi:hypothetical protein